MYEELEEPEDGGFARELRLADCGGGVCAERERCEMRDDFRGE